VTVAPDVRARLTRLVTGHILTQCLYCVARLGVVDAMPVGEATAVDEIATRVGAHADSLYRVMRALAAEGLFEEVEPGRFRATEIGELFRDGDGSLRYGALLHGGQTMPLFVHMLETVKTGMPVPILREGKTRWEQLAEDPEQSEIFNRAMRGRAPALAGTLGALDWHGVQDVVDVGGGIGGVLLPLLQAKPRLHGVLFDLEHVAADARAAIEAAGVADRCTFVSGSFFERVPPNGDVYVLSNVLHDWNDEDALRILETCREAIPADSKLVVLENLVPEGNDPHPVKIMDLQMLVALGGRERTQTEFTALLRRGGFELDGVSGEGPYALEARPI
jgi:hypothetical protein